MHLARLFVFSELTPCCLHLSVNEVSGSEFRIPKVILIFLRCAAEQCCGTVEKIEASCWMINREMLHKLRNDDLSVS